MVRVQFQAKQATRNDTKWRFASAPVPGSVEGSPRNRRPFLAMTPVQGIP